MLGYRAWFDESLPELADADERIDTRLDMHAVVEQGLELDPLIDGITRSTCDPKRIWEKRWFWATLAFRPRSNGMMQPTS